METETKAPRKVREIVTVDKCHQWLQLAYYETLRFGFCEPIKWMEQAGRKVLPTIARDKGYLINAPHKGHSQWFDMKIQPNEEMAKTLQQGYLNYRHEHGIAQQNRRRAEVKEKAKRMEAAEAAGKAAVETVPEQLELAKEGEPVRTDSPETAQIITAIMSLRIEVLALNEGQKHIQSVINRVQTDLQSFMTDMGSKSETQPPVSGNAEDFVEQEDPF